MERQAPRAVEVALTGRKALLADSGVRAWHEARSLRSLLSADTDLRKLGLLLDRLGLGPEQVVSTARDDPDGLRARLTRYAADLKRAKKRDTYIEKTFSGLRNYLVFRHVPFDGYPKLEPIHGTSLERERVPTPEELAVVLERLTLRGRTIALLMAHAGLRPQVLGSYRGERGLTLRDLPELTLGGGPAFKEVPFVVRVPAGLSKTRRAYITFGTQQLATTIIAYLQERRRRGERLTPESPVVAASFGLKGAASRHVSEARFGRGFLATTNITVETARVLHRSAPDGVTWRSYVLRSYCSTRLLMAEGEGRISRDLREAILGHDGGVAARYNVGKAWGAELLEEARREYARASDFLSTIPSAKKPGRDVEMVRLMLDLLGVPEGKVSDAELRKATPERLKEIAREYAGHHSAAHQRVVSNGEIPKLLGEGWTFVATLADDRAILKPPEAA